MSRLFIELYLDEDVSVLVADLLRARGFGAMTTVEANLLGSTDAEQLAHAVSERRAFLTHNRADFEALARDYFAAGRTHHGIIIAVRRPPRELARRLLLILNRVTADEMENQLLYVWFPFASCHSPSISSSDASPSARPRDAKPRSMWRKRRRNLRFVSFSAASGSTPR